MNREEILEWTKRHLKHEELESSYAASLLLRRNLPDIRTAKGIETSYTILFLLGRYYNKKVSDKLNLPKWVLGKIVPLSVSTNSRLLNSKAVYYVKKNRIEIGTKGMGEWNADTAVRTVMLLAHELAHIIVGRTSGGIWHSRLFRTVCKELGGNYLSAYDLKRRYE